MNLGICVYGVKLKFGGSALLPLNAALCAGIELVEYMENSKEVPEQVKGWNWGAFAFSWIWGIRFRTYRALLVFVPLVNIAMPFILGFKGNEWAWKHNQ
ncbi:hypothetical protein ND979_07310 [Vibrio diabolicus]|nr:hypothetical protein [Vibrio diabolicus]